MPNAALSEALYVSIERMVMLVMVVAEYVCVRVCLRKREKREIDKLTDTHTYIK